LIGRIASLGFVVENFAFITLEFTWVDTVEADVELLAIFGMSVVGMSDDLSCGVVFEFVFGANESVL
jgi:hypothetical protein